MPRHLHELKPPKPPHELKIVGRTARALVLATCLTGGFALALAVLQFPLNVVVPSSAPVWAGLSTVLK